MDIQEFKATAHQLVDWIAAYFENIESYPVKAQVKPGETYDQLPDLAPDQGEDMQRILKDFEQIILPGMTHWQHPNFHAYFNGNSSYPSLLAEMLTATLAAQCMIWETSPAATELEEKMMDWLKELLHLPNHWSGVIQDGASTATLVSLITAREKATRFVSNRQGLQKQPTFRMYCSHQAHSSIQKAVRIAGLGEENLVKVKVDEDFALVASDLRACIEADIEDGYTPLWVVATLGTTGSTAVDPVPEIASLCKQHDLWLHVDAAWAGTALMLPNHKWLGEGLEHAHSFVFNPHKWMFTNFDCTAYFVQDSELLQNTFTLIPEYLKTKSHGQVNNYSDWGIQLGRRFRALKLWFVLRSFGKEELRRKIGQHVNWAQQMAEEVREHQMFELLVEAPLATVCFRLHPPHINDSEQLNTLNETLLHTLNQTGKIYLTHTKLGDVYTLRLVVGQTYQEKRHLEKAWELIKATSVKLVSKD